MNATESQPLSRMMAAAVLRLACAALIGAGGALASGGAPDESPADAAGNRMTLAGGEVAIAYPEILGLAVSQEQLLTSSMIPVCGEAFDYCLYLPESEFAGTNLSAAGLRISERDDLTAEISCLLAQPAGWRDLQPAVLRGAPLSTSRFGGLGQGAAGSYSRGDLLRLWTGENCYEFESRMVLTRYENYEPGTITEFSEEEQDALAERFGGVIDSATLVSGEAVSWPTAPRSTLEAFVRVESPRSSAGVTSPMTVSGEAVGNWFFEGTFPLELIGESGEVLATGYVIADGYWMTTDFVAFSGELEFEVEERTEATLVLRRDNPSDLPENDAAVRVPVTLLPE